jgi:hypothetical protein
MIIGYERVSTAEPNLGLQHDDLKPAFKASVDQADARNAPLVRQSWRVNENARFHFIDRNDRPAQGPLPRQG